MIDLRDVLNKVEFPKLLLKGTPLKHSLFHVFLTGKDNHATTVVAVYDGVVAQVRSRNPEFPFYLEYLV